VEWLYKQFLLGMLADKPGKAKREYTKFMQEEDSPEVMDFFSKKNMPSVYGSVDFVQRIKEKYYELKKHDEVPQTRQLAPTVAEIKKAVSESYGIKERALEQTRRGWENEPRNVAIYLSRKMSGLRLEEIGKEFGLGNYSSVSSIVIRLESRLSHSKQLPKRLKEINRRIEKNQTAIKWSAVNMNYSPVINSLK
jgi:hypothetical protein